MKNMHNCIIKVIHNSGQPRGYSVERKENSVHIVIRVQTIPTDLDYMAKLIREEMVFKKRYSVVFNFKSVSDAIKNHYPFREAMIKMLQQKDSEMDFDAILEIVRLHMQLGKYPKFEDYENPKTFKRISNYVNSVTGITISQAVVTALCKKITDLL